VNDNFQHAVKVVAALEEQLDQPVWTEAERDELNLSLKIARSDVRVIKADLMVDGFSKATVDALERQFIAEFMGGSPS
jgi:hypothetical protein